MGQLDCRIDDKIEFCMRLNETEVLLTYYTINHKKAKKIMRLYTQ